MRLATIGSQEETEVGVVRDSSIVPLRSLMGDAPTDMLSLLRRFGSDLGELQRLVEGASPTGEALALTGLRLAAPLARPGNILGIGRNYDAHAREGGLAQQEKPRIFLKPSSSISGPNDVIRRPASVRKLDFEAELVAVVGAQIASASDEEAAAAIAGYTIGNDFSAREFQFDVNPPQTSFAKGMDGFAAIGPWLVTADELGSAPDLAIRCWVNGRLMQDARTKDLIFPVSTCLAYISRFLTLEPGDILFTGTPSGVGVFRDPPVYLEPGDTVRVEIEGIGSLESRIG